ncbi:MAG TPA: type II toxin-antitoxin system VapC family toxin [Burkholderiaceae bacterium]|nr:type II toxin-antitoxin system VapC family toxin [Burkholderiaceae bacterium]
MSLIYLDTSVLAKRYLRDARSDDVDALLDHDELSFVVSDLCVVELESVVARRSREAPEGKLDRGAVRSRIEQDMRSGFFLVHPLETDVLIEVRRLIVEGEPLATLDALHLATALRAGADTLATDDRQFAHAARAVGLSVTTFV